MKISLGRLIKRETDNLDLNFCEKIDTINYCDKLYKLTTPMSIQGKISTTNKGYLLEAKVDFSVLDECSRCLDEVEVNLNYDIHGFLVKEDFDEDMFEDCDAFIYENQEFDLLDVVIQTLDFNISQSILCDEDCEGLCHICGTNLNEKDCSCNVVINDEEHIDSRFAKLKDLFKND